MSGYLAHVLFFTLLQASLSTLLSLFIAVPVTRAIMRQAHLWWGQVLLSLFALPIMIPAIAALFGLIALFGANGLLAKGAALIGLPWFNFYGLPGILVAHIFLNFPLAVRLLLLAYQQVPYETWRLAASLDFTPLQYWRFIDWPVFRQQLPMIAALVFLLCLSSFSIILTLGGGPKYATLEVAIFQALRFEFNPSLALKLAAIQIILASLILLIAVNKQGLALTGVRLRSSLQRWERQQGILFRLEQAFLLFAGIFIAVPILFCLLSGLYAFGALLDRGLMAPLARSFLYSLGAGTACVFFAWGWSILFYRAQGKWQKTILGAFGLAYLIVSPVMVGSLLLVLSAGTEFAEYMLHGLIILLYIFLGLPYAIYAFWPAYQKMRRDYDRLFQSLPIGSWQRLFRIEWPLLSIAGRKAGLYAALAIFGDFGLVAVLGDRRALNLPWYLYDQLGSYRSGPAAATSMLMLVIAFVMVQFAERGGGHHFSRA